jgi:hypothetical protein
MIPDIPRQTVRLIGLPVIVALATTLVAATIDAAGNWARLRALPQAERARLAENLRKFDLVYSQEQQQAIRELDRRINELDPASQVQYLAALRRYHNWLNLLPETKQDGLKDKAASERMALVKKLLADYPVPKAITSPFLRLVDVGEDSPFDLAAMYQTWQKLKPDERRKVEQLPQEPRRREALFRLGEKYNITRALKPGGFDEEKWTAQLEAFAKKNRPVLLLEKADKMQEARKAEILRRQAINYHFLAIDRPKAVAGDRLAEFLASFPPWLKSRIDHFPPDEARRRLSVVYRLVYPSGSPSQPATPADTSSPGTRSSPVPAGRTPGTDARVPAPSGRSPF